jgi:hypothetical protein
MAWCGSAQKKQPVDLTKQNFEEIRFTVKGSTYKFDTIDGLFRTLENNQNKGPKTEKFVGEEQANLERDIKLKQARLANLKSKLVDLEKKQVQMMEVLNIDINEKEHILNLKARCERNKVV